MDKAPQRSGIEKSEQLSALATQMERVGQSVQKIAAEPLPEDRELTLDDLRQQAQKLHTEASQLEVVFEQIKQLGKSGFSFEDLSNLYKLRSEIAKNCYRSLNQVYERMPFEQLSPEQRATALEIAALAHGELKQKKFRFPNVGFGQSSLLMEKDVPLAELKKRFMLHPELTFTPQEIKQVIDTQKNIFKIHVEVPVEKLLAVQNVLLAGRSEIQTIVNQLYEQASGKYVSTEAAYQAGAQLIDLSQWKFHVEDVSTDHLGQKFPRLVIYPSSPASNEDARAQVERLLTHLDQRLAPLNLPRSEAPRYSQAFGESGAVFWSQGDSDVKNTLKAQGLLDTYFDKSTNYSMLLTQN